MVAMEGFLGARDKAFLEWAPRAKCRGMDPDMFYPGPGEAMDGLTSFCGDCPVREKCLEYALENNEAGIWGGTSARERRKIKHDRGTLKRRKKIRDHGRARYLHEGCRCDVCKEANRIYHQIRKGRYTG